MSPNSILVDFISELDPNISMLLYGLASTNLDEAKIEKCFRNPSSKCKDNTIKNKKLSTSITISLKINHQIITTSTAITATTISK